MINDSLNKIKENTDNSVTLSGVNVLSLKIAALWSVVLLF